jgi:hypothetical protein
VDYERFDNDANESDEDYFAFVEWLSDLAAAELREAKHDPARQRQALCRYYKRGFRAHVTTSELIDFLGVSSPSILERAGYSAAEGDALMRLSDALTDEEIRRADLPGVA